MSSSGKAILALAASAICLQGLRAQEVELIIEPEAPAIRGCDELAVSVRARTSGAPVGGYQLFVTFPAERFEALRFEPGAISASVFTAGPAPFGSGAGDCGDAVDPWDDGLGDDVVAIAASVIGESDQDPLEGGEALVGTIVFRPIVASSRAEDAAFALDPPGCGELFDRTTRVFAPSGAALDATLSGSFGVEVVDAGAVVADLACELAEGAARLSWTLPSQPIAGLEVFRDAERIATLPSGATEYVDDAIEGLLGRLEYEVAAVLETVEPCERASCGLTIAVMFRRGDVDGSGGLNITDPVLLLRHLFRGEDIDCQDAADGNDDGSLNITDGVFLLEYQFRSGDAPPAPFPDPGVDPTPDALDCARYGA